MAINDEILRATGGDSLPDGLLSFYQAGGATSNALQDAESEYLLAQVAVTVEEAIPDMWDVFLTDAGHTGSLDDQKLQYWTAQP